MKGELVKLVEKVNRETKDQFKNAIAYWISPDNYVIPIQATHIDLINTNPEKFGLSKDYIVKLHKKHKEHIGSEGHARNEIMTDLVKKGWLRLRFHAREMVWVAQIESLDRQTADRIQSWAARMIKETPQQKNATIQVVDLNADPIISYMEDIRLSNVASGAKRWKQYVQSGGRLSIAQMFHEHKMIFVEDIKSFPGIIA